MAYQTGVEMESVPCLEGDGEYRYEYDTGETSASMAVVTGLSRALDTAPTALEPLQRTVDLDALDALLTSVDGDEVWVTLKVTDCTVGVSSTGVLTVARDSVDSEY